jgi:hypothetical protein
MTYNPMFSKMIAGLSLTITTVALMLVGCISNIKSTTSSENNAYEIFESEFLNIQDNFISESFIMDETLVNEYYSNAIPENNFFSENDDLYENNPLKPKNRRLLYYSKDNDIVISLSYLFSEDNLDKSFVTIDSVPVDLINTKIKDTNYQVPPYLDQFVMTNDHAIILLKIIYIGNGTITDQERIEYSNSVKKFFSDFTDFLSRYHS